MLLERLTKTSPTNEAPSASELRRNDLLVAGVVLFALFLAFGIRNQVIYASKSVRLGENLPRISYPDRWRVQNTDGTLLHAINAGSPSTFDTQMLVTSRSLRSDETLEDARADQGIKQATSLNGYRELLADRMTVQGGQPALVTTYAFVADPTLDMGAMGLPVVVEAQDIMFLQDGQLVVVTLAADANDWEDEQNEFSIITNSLRLQPVADNDSLIVTPTPASAPATTPAVEAAPAPGDTMGVEPGTPPADVTPQQGDSFGGSQAGDAGTDSTNSQGEGGN
jgi:hypothetical protein